MNYLSLVISFAPKIVLGLFLALGFFHYLFRRQLNYKWLAIILVASRIFYAIFLTAAQYYAWSKNVLTGFLLDSPLDQSLPAPSLFKRFGYFAFYAYGRFWLNAFIAIGVAFAFYLFLKFLKKRQERFFEEGETELGFLAALIVGWPNFVIFAPLVFVSVVLISIFRGFFLKEAYTTLGWPFLLAAFLTLIWGSWLIQIFHLGVLKI